MFDIYNAKQRKFDTELLIADFYTLEALSLCKFEAYHSHSKLKSDILELQSKFDDMLSAMMFDYSVYACFRELRHYYKRTDCIDDFYFDGLNIRLDKNECFDAFKEFTPYELLKSAEFYFNDEDWENHYGGYAWSIIARNTAKYGSIPNHVYVDMCFSLSHNSSIYLDKEYLFDVVSNHKIMLDMKFEAESTDNMLQNFYKFTSLSVKKLTDRAIRLGLVSFNPHYNYKKYSIQNRYRQDCLTEYHYEAEVYGIKRIPRLENPREYIGKLGVMANKATDVVNINIRPMSYNEIIDYCKEKVGRINIQATSIIKVGNAYGLRDIYDKFHMFVDDGSTKKSRRWHSLNWSNGESRIEYEVIEELVDEKFSVANLIIRGDLLMLVGQHLCSEEEERYNTMKICGKLDKSLTELIGYQFGNYILLSDGVMSSGRILVYDVLKREVIIKYNDIMVSMNGSDIVKCFGFGVVSNYGSGKVGIDTGFVGNGRCKLYGKLKQKTGVIREYYDGYSFGIKANANKYIGTIRNKYYFNFHKKYLNSVIKLDTKLLDNEVSM